MCKVPLCPVPTSTISPATDIPHQTGMLVATDELRTLLHHYHLGAIRSVGFCKYIMMCLDHGGVVQFHCPQRPLFCLAVPPSALPRGIYSSFLLSPFVLPFPGCVAGRSIQHSAFPGWLLSRSNMHLWFLPVFLWLGSSFLFSAE